MGTLEGHVVIIASMLQKSPTLHMGTYESLRERESAPSEGIYFLLHRLLSCERDCTDKHESSTGHSSAAVGCTVSCISSVTPANTVLTAATNSLQAAVPTKRKRKFPGPAGVLPKLVRFPSVVNEE